MANSIISADVTGSQATELVERYAKEARRLKMDLKHQRENRILSMRHRLESELLDVEIDHAAVSAHVGSLVPAVPALSDGLTFNLPREIVDLSPTTIILNQQVFEHVQGIVTQELSGTIHLGSESLQLLKLIDNHGSDQDKTLESAVHELEDEDAKRDDRIRAAQKLKGFLFKIGDHVGAAALSICQKYIESKLGL